MKKSRSRRIPTRTPILAIVLLALSAPAAPGQQNPFGTQNSSPSDAVIFHGNPPLTEGMVTLYANFDTWMLEIPSSAQNRDLVRAKLLKDWKDPAQIKGDMWLLDFANSLMTKTPEEREFIRWDIQWTTLGSIRADSSSYGKWMVAAYEQTHRPIAPGNPPLTESLISRFTTFFCWALEIPYSSTAALIDAIPLQQALRNTLIEDWQKPAEIKSDMNFLNWQVSMAHVTPEQREYARISAQPFLLKQLRADKRSLAAQRLAAAYDAAHPVIAAGNPPLTRQAVDAFTEFMCFTQVQGGGSQLDCSAALKDGNARELAKTFRTLSVAQQKELTEMPQNWALLQLGWAMAPEADRQKMRAQLQPAGQASAVNDPRWVAAQAAAQRANDFVKRDPHMVTDQELHAAAADADTVAREYRSFGTPEYLQLAVKWEQFAGPLHVSQPVYAQAADRNLIQAAQSKASNDQLLIMMALQNQQRYNTQLQQSLNSVNVLADVNGRNNAAHVNNTPADWVVRRNY